MNAPDLSKVADWLIDGARSATSPPRMMAETCERLLRPGCRCGASASSFGRCIPIFSAAGFIWRPGAEVVVNAADFDIQDSPEFKNSPLAILYDSGREVRYRLDDPESKRFPVLRRHARRRRHRLYRAAASVYRRLDSRIELDHEAAGRLQRRTTGRAAIAGAAAGAGGRDRQLAPHRLDPARHLCRQPRRRADSRRPDSPRPHRYHACRDLAVGSARLYRAFGPAAGRNRGGYSQSLFRLPGVGDQDAWRGSPEVHGRRAARGVSDRRI